MTFEETPKSKWNGLKYEFVQMQGLIQTIVEIKRVSFKLF